MSTLHKISKDYMLGYGKGYEEASKEYSLQDRAYESDLNPTIKQGFKDGYNKALLYIYEGR